MKRLIVGILSIAVLSFLSACAGPYHEPVVVGPPPAVEVVPEYYVWDGYEYVGVANGRYVYLGPGQVWRVCEPYRVQRFHEWERLHPDWTQNAIRNEQHALENQQRNQEHAIENEQRNQQHALENKQRNEQNGLENQQRNEQNATENKQRNQQHALENKERNLEHQQQKQQKQEEKELKKEEQEK